MFAGVVPGIRKFSALAYRVLATINSVICLSLVYHYVIGGGQAVSNAVLTAFRAEETQQVGTFLADFIAFFALMLLLMVACFYISRESAPSKPAGSNPKDNPVPVHSC